MPKVAKSRFSKLTQLRYASPMDAYPIRCARPDRPKGMCPGCKIEVTIRKWSPNTDDKEHKGKTMFGNHRIGGGNMTRKDVPCPYSGTVFD